MIIWADIPKDVILGALEKDSLEKGTFDMDSLDMRSLEKNSFEKGSFHDVCEAMADFYACCKLKLHFNIYMEIERFSLKDRFRLKKRTYDKIHLESEERYKKFNISRELPLEERTQHDHVYSFYRNKNDVTGWYMICFKDICRMDYLNYFDWDDFLTKIGWDNDEERWKYISYKNRN
jgi:hypothetical protein